MDRNSLNTFNEIERVDTVCFEITDRCPLACAHCSVSAGPGKSQIIPFDFFQSSIDVIQKKGCKHILLAGGEPFVLSNFDDYAAYAYSSGATVSVLTSGITLKDGIAVAITTDAYKHYLEIGVGRVVFSIYADIAAVHDQITKLPQSLDQTLASIDNAQSAGLDCEINFVPMKPNWRYLEAVLKLAADHQVTTVNCLRFVPQGRGLGMEYFFQLDELEEQGFADMVSALLQTELGAGLRIGMSFESLIPQAIDQRTLAKRSLHVTTSGDVLASADRRTELVASNYS